MEPSDTPGARDEATWALLQASFEETFAAATVGGVQAPGAVAYLSIGDQEWISALRVSDVDVTCRSISRSTDASEHHQADGRDRSVGTRRRRRAVAGRYAREVCHTGREW